MSNKIASKRYAVALFDTVQNEQLDALLADAQSLSGVISESAELDTLLKSPARLEEGSMFVRNQQPNRARDIFTEVIKLDENWAEAWNKRATVLYMLGEYQKSQDDIDKVLELEPRHFGALAGQGLVNIQLKNFEKAIRSYKQAQEIYPSMRSPEIMIKQIEDLMKEQTI